MREQGNEVKVARFKYIIPYQSLSGFHVKPAHMHQVNKMQRTKLVVSAQRENGTLASKPQPHMYIKTNSV